MGQSSALLGSKLEIDEFGYSTISGVPLHPLSSTRPAHTTVHFPDDSSDELDRMEEDEDTLRRANSDVMQMQRQMMDGQLAHAPNRSYRH